MWVRLKKEASCDFINFLDMNLGGIFKYIRHRENVQKKPAG